MHRRNLAAQTSLCGASFILLPLKFEITNRLLCAPHGGYIRAVRRVDFLESFEHSFQWVELKETPDENLYGQLHIQKRGRPKITIAHIFVSSEPFVIILGLDQDVGDRAGRQVAPAAVVRGPPRSAGSVAMKDNSRNGLRDG